jgi:hypothetical protein
VPDDAGRCVCASAALEVLGSCVPGAVLFPAVICPVLALLIIGNAITVALMRRHGEEREDERLLRRAVAALRAQLGVTARDGFLVGSERPPFRLQQVEMRALPREGVEAAGRLALRLEYDVGHLDVFCLAIAGDGAGRAARSLRDVRQERSPQHVALRAWLLNVAEILIAPDIDSDSVGEPPCSGVSTTWQVGSGERVGEAGPWAGAVARELRFDYFVRLLARAQAWREDGGQLFGQLQAAAAGGMRRVATLCDARFADLLAAPRGDELLHLVPPQHLWSALTPHSAALQ